MFKQTKTYGPDTPQVSAQDLNTFGDVTRLVGNITGKNVYMDLLGIHFRGQPAPGPQEDLTAQYDGMLFQSGADLAVAAGYLRLVNGPAT
jgi:hypothetical protein